MFLVVFKLDVSAQGLRVLLRIRVECSRIHTVASSMLVAAFFLFVVAIGELVLVD